jgi:hypothetical protein
MPRQNLVLYILLTVRLYDGWSPSNEIAQLSKQWAEWDVLTSLANYRFVVQTLFEYFKVRSCHAPNIPLSESSPHDQKSSNLRRVSAIEVADRLSQDISCVIQQINSILSDRATYKKFLSCRGTVAQQLLDLLQDVYHHLFPLIALC